MATRLITLTTDFGSRDPYAGIMKGVILGINPEANIIDLAHGIPPQDVRAGALALNASLPYFPAGTIHIAVVDPGVGSKRRALLIESERAYFIGPDNGIFSLVLEGRPIQQIVELSNPDYHLKPASATFHGRDIFAPAAAYLSLGISTNELGAEAQDFTRLPWPRISKRETSIEGKVIYIDGFGNLITNIRENDLPANRSGLTISVRGIAIRGLVPSYAWGREGEYVALINSSALLEIALSNGNAQAASGAEIGDEVAVQESPKTYGG